MNNLRKVGLLVILFATSGCYMFNEPLNNPFDPAPLKRMEDMSPLERMAQRCVDAGDVWERDRLQCRQVAPWKKNR